MEFLYSFTWQTHWPHMSWSWTLFRHNWNVWNVKRYNQNYALGCLIWQIYVRWIVTEKRNCGLGEPVSGLLQKKQWKKMIRTWTMGCGNRKRRNNTASEESAGVGWWPYMGSRESGEVQEELGDEANTAAVKEITKSDYKGLRK